MNSTIRKLSLFLLIFCCSLIHAQVEINEVKEDGLVDHLFAADVILPVKFKYSIKELRSQTNDSTYIESQISFQDEDGSWNELPLELRLRGNFRLNNCYYPPLKLKIKKRNAKGTLFEGHKRLKVVLPCMTEKDRNDNVIKEYLAYQLFELLSPYHFKTRLIDIEFTELRGKREKVHQIKGFLIEDDKHVAKRLNGNVYERSVHPLQQDDLASVRNALFQYLIGNTDYSQGYGGHNMKIFFIDKSYIPVPYDFDMAGMVNCSYSVVSQINNKQLPISSVKERLYRGFKRDPAVFQQVRREFLEKKNEIIETVSSCEYAFDNEREYTTCRDYLAEFFEVLEDDEAFRDKIIAKARTQ